MFRSENINELRNSGDEGPRLQMQWNGRACKVSIPTFKSIGEKEEKCEIEFEIGYLNLAHMISPQEFPLKPLFVSSKTRACHVSLRCRLHVDYFAKHLWMGERKMSHFLGYSCI